MERDPEADPFSQDGYPVRLEWGVEGVTRLAPRCAVVVVVDVLSFSTTVSVAMERGLRVMPSRWGDERAADDARSLGAVLAGPHRSDKPSLSPASLMSLPSGMQLVLPSPNGSTCCALASAAGATVVSACLRNAQAVGSWLRITLDAAHDSMSARSAVAVVPAGERWPSGALRPALEDLVGAGAVLAAAVAAGVPGEWLSPEACLALMAHDSLGEEVARAVTSSVSGRELIERGFPDDVRLALQHDATDLVPLMVDGVFIGVGPSDPRS